MTSPRIIRNVYCTHPDDAVVEWKCVACQRCWLFVAGRKTGTCPYNGPFSGFEVTFAPDTISAHDYDHENVITPKQALTSKGS